MLENDNFLLPLSGGLTPSVTSISLNDFNGSERRETIYIFVWGMFDRTGYCVNCTLDSQSGQTSQSGPCRACDSLTLSLSPSHVSLLDWQNTKGQLNIYFIHDNYRVQSAANMYKIYKANRSSFFLVQIDFFPIKLTAARISTNIHPMTTVGWTGPGESVCTFLSLLKVVVSWQNIPSKWKCCKLENRKNVVWWMS